MCSCNREKVFYKCKEQSCQRFGTQKFYCTKCLAEAKHPHFPLYEIVHEIENFDHQWSKLLEKYETTIKASKVSYEKMEPLIKYLETEAIDNPIGGQ